MSRWGISDIEAAAAEHDRGRWFDLRDPVTGRPVGIRLLVAGPDGRVQARARIALADELAEASDADGRVSGEARERARLNNLARCVLDWEVFEDGVAVPFSHRNVVRLLRAAFWVQAQVDGFASDRLAFGEKGTAE